MKIYLAFIFSLLYFSDVYAMDHGNVREGTVAKLKRVFSDPTLSQTVVQESNERKHFYRQYEQRTVKELRELWEPNGGVKRDESAATSTFPTVRHQVSNVNQKKPKRSLKKISRKKSILGLKFVHKAGQKQDLQRKYRNRSETLPVRTLSPRSRKHRNLSILDMAKGYYDDFLNSFSNNSSRKTGDLVISHPEIDTEKTSHRVFSIEVFQERLSKLLLIYDALRKIISLHIERSDIDSINAPSVKSDLKELGEMYEKGHILNKKLEKAKEEEPIRANLMKEGEELQQCLNGEAMGSIEFNTACKRGLKFVSQLEDLFSKAKVGVYLEEKFDLDRLVEQEAERIKLFQGLREMFVTIQKTKHSSQMDQIFERLGKVRKLLEKEQRDLETTGAEFIQSLERLQKSYYRVVKFATKQRESLSSDELEKFAKKVEDTLKESDKETTSTSMSPSSSRAMITNPGIARRSPSGLRNTRMRAHTEVGRRNLHRAHLGS